MSDTNCEWNFFLPLFCRKLWGWFITSNGICYVKITRTVHNIKNLSALELFGSGLIFVNRHMDEKLRGRRGQRDAEKAAVLETKKLEKKSYL
jgi:hypothetical protein